MSFNITGLDKLQREMEEAGAALAALDGELTVVRFDPNDLASVEAAIVQLEGSIDEKIASYRGNAVVESIASQLKEKYCEQLLERAARARSSQEGNSTGMAAMETTILSQIQNTLTDLRAAEYNTYERHIKKLSRILHAPELDEISRKLTDGIDLESWLAVGLSTQGGMAGSAVLSWPPEHEKELGTVVLLIDRFAEKPDEALNFSLTFYYAGSGLTDNLQSMTRQMIVPFARDYINYVKAKTEIVDTVLLPARRGPAGRQVFIVHGHDEGVREAVARFLERMGFEPIILHAQPNQGRTIIEKFEAHSDVGFAVVLLTPDDVGGPSAGELQSRARQNVILELGYFIGRLTRARVCALKKGDIELPSDILGVVWEEFDEHGAWKMKLAKELRAAKYDIDLNKAFGV